MNIDKRILKSEEEVVFKLRDMYIKHGYSCFKMAKFEEYDLYSQNRDFLVSDSVITFNDTNGKLMALKPDVTLSIVKNFREEGGVKRVYYNENVYRVSDKTHCYKEIMQSGIEALGEVTEYNLFEVVCLAAESLACISSDCVLNISHLGILSELICGMESETKAEILNCIGEKNAHGVREVCEKNGVCDETTELLAFLANGSGDYENAIGRLRELTENEKILASLDSLETIIEQVKKVSKVCVRADFSTVSDMNYYNGLVFRGFIKGIPSGVLSGGQYDKLMSKLGKCGGAVGFAVYLDLFERMKEPLRYDVDVLLLYKPDDDMKKVHEAVSAFIADGKSVSAQTSVPAKLTYRELVRL